MANIVDDSRIGFKNPQRGRVYSPDGIAPALNTVGGGGLEPKIILYTDDTGANDHMHRERRFDIV